VEGRAFDSISLHTVDGDEVPITRALNGDTVKLSPEAALEPGQAYEISIPSGAVQDRYKNDSTPETIRFRTQGSDTIPEVRAGRYGCQSTDNSYLFRKG